MFRGVVKRIIHKSWSSRKRDSKIFCGVYVEQNQSIVSTQNHLRVVEMGSKNYNDAVRLKQTAFQIAAQLPTEQDEALKILELARQLVLWKIALNSAAPVLHLISGS